MRNIADDPKSLTLKDDLTNAQRGSSSGKIKVKVMPDEEEEGVSKGTKTAQLAEEASTEGEKAVTDVKSVVKEAGERFLETDADLG